MSKKEIIQRNIEESKKVTTVKESNREILNRYAKKLGLRVSIYDNNMNKLTYKQLHRVVDAMEFGSGDVPVLIDGKRHIIEIMQVDDELDFIVYSQQAFNITYGWDYFEEE